MLVYVIAAVILLAGIISLLPLKYSLYTCLYLIAGSFAGLIILSAINFGIISTAYLILGAIGLSLLAFLGFNNAYRFNAERIDRIN